jgi:hypothetical protein
MSETDPQAPRRDSRRRTVLLWVAALFGLEGLTCLGLGWFRFWVRCTQPMAQRINDNIAVACVALPLLVSAACAAVAVIRPREGQGAAPGRAPGGLPRPAIGWRALRVCLTLLALALYLLGALGLLRACLDLEIGLTRLGLGWLLLFVVWAVAPFASAVLLFRAANRLREPGAEASASLVVAAAAAFVGLAWVGVTVALLLGGGVGR